MRFDLSAIVTKRFKLKSMLWLALTTTYICFSLFLFFYWVAPSLDGRTDQHIAADSTTYLYFADSLREGRIDPVVIAALSTFPNNLLCPTLIALVLKSTFAMVIANYAMLFLALALLKRSFQFSHWTFIGLLFINATTTISLLSVNKEIVDLLAISIFLFARRRHHHGILLFAILLASFNRLEVGMVMLIFLCAESKLNPWRQKRVMTLVAIAVVLGAALPLLASGTLNARFEEAQGGHTVAWLDFLEIHYLYAVAVIPKIAENLFGELANFSKIGAYIAFSDIANTYIVFLNNLATAIVLVLLVKKRMFTVKHDLVYFAVIGWIIMAVALVIQPRYFYFTYVLLCLQASRPAAEEPMRHGGIAHRLRYTKHDAPALGNKDIALG